MSLDRIVIVGSSGHAKVVIDIVRKQGVHELVGLVDRFRPVGESTFGFDVLGTEADLPRLVRSHGIRGVLIAIGDNWSRERVADQIIAANPGLFLARAIHPSANLALEASIGDGTVVMAGASIGPAATIGRGCIVNSHASIDHDAVMHDFASLGPGAVTGGGCRIGQQSAIGIGSVLLQGRSIGAHCVVGAGSLVTRDIGDAVVAYGRPAKIVRTRQASDPYL
ncbi:acetyltransferase [soil metagenome]